MPLDHGGRPAIFKRSDSCSLCYVSSTSMKGTGELDGVTDALVVALEELCTPYTSCPRAL